MKKIIIILFLFISLCQVQAQQSKPKLVVGIVVDQMRQEYLQRFGSRFSDSGFKLLMEEGYEFKNMHYNYVPTYTAPGHAAVYTGATPSFNGIIGNGWYDKAIKKMIYCAEDSTVSTIGSSSEYGMMSPKNLLTTTITDQVRLSSQMRSKVIGISIKDRGAIFPAGHTGEAYWYDKSIGGLITSSYYFNKLPDWVAAFNDLKLADDYLEQKWETKYPKNTYINSGADAKPYESGLGGHTDFPYDFKKMKADYGMLPETPFGNSFLTEAAKAAVNNTDLGEDDITDFLVVSFSSTDYIGHNFGPNSVEIEDTYLRLDQNIADLIETLNNKVGEGNYMVFLTADHAVAEIPQRLSEENVPASRFEKMVGQLNVQLEKQFGVADLIENASNEQIFFNHDKMEANKLSLESLSIFTQNIMLSTFGVVYCYRSSQIQNMDYNAGGMTGLLRRGYHQKRSGDLLYVLNPAWINGNPQEGKGTTHGSGYTYDTHVPMLWYGNGIKKGKSFKKHSITQIAPTLSMLLGVMLPNGAIDEPLYELLEK